MMNIPRWHWDFDARKQILGMVRQDDGQWVRWEDCERLLKRIAELQEALTEARKK